MKSFVSVSVLAVLIAYAYANPLAETTCQTHKRNSQTSIHNFAMDITCHPTTGMYDPPMQCTTATPKWCQCFMPDRPVSQMSTKLKRCDCHMAKGAAQDSNKEECEILKCNSDGSYQIEQTICVNKVPKKMCVNKDTGEKTMELGNGETCPTTTS